MSGSDPLAGLKPLHAPPPISWWPPALGWWLLAALVLILALLTLWWRNRTTLQRAALIELESLATRLESPEQRAAALNRLLKRYALACAPGTDVGSLTGEAWLAYLDRHGGGEQFSRGPGRALLSLPYGGGAPAADDLLPLARRWIKANRPRR